MMMKHVAAILAGIGCSTVGGYAAYWHFGAGAIEDLVLARIGQERDRGMQIHYATLERGGFPAHVQLRLTEVAIEGPSGGWSLRVPELLLEVAPWRPLRQEVTVRGPVEARLHDHGRVLALRLTTDRLGGHVDLASDGRLERAGLAGSALNLEAEGAAALPRSVAAEGLRLDFRDMGLGAQAAGGAPDPVGEASLMLQGITMDGAVMPLGPRIERIGLRAILKGSLPSGIDPGDRLEHWRDAGGVVEMPWLALDWGQLGLTGNGAIALDAVLRPLGSIALRVAGFRETLGDLAQAGIIDSRSAGAVGLAMSLFARSPPEGGPPVVETVLRMQDGEIALGPFRLGRLSPVLSQNQSDRQHGAAPAPGASEPAVERMPPPPPVQRLTRPLVAPPQLAPNWVSRPEPRQGGQPPAPAPAD